MVFSLALARPGEQNNIDENLHENPVFDFGRNGLHSFIRGGQADLQEDRQELSDE
ncbi:MAG TPA: hypothetical protein VN827_00185 [Chthoniobacterales bacterium]|jgi:hypothetical protein|nr:hypothetical protein [Chthoniobacterales bacterium]